MFIKRYVAKSLPQVLTVIKAELGSEAVILSKRKIRAVGWSGLFGVKVYEVVAGREYDDYAREAPVNALGASPGFQASLGPDPRFPALHRESAPAGGRAAAVHRESAPAGGRAAALHPERAPTAGHAPADAKGKRVVVGHASSAGYAVSGDGLAAGATGAGAVAVERELRDLRSLLTALIGPGGLPGLDRTALGRVVERLMHAQLPAPLLERFLMTEAAHSDIRDPRAVDAALTRFSRTLLQETGPVRTIGGSDRVVAFFGPTGVGKTTTIAKLAAQAKLRDGRSVGLLTVDTFRMAAVQQLKTYADILSIPLAVARSAAEVEERLHSMSKLDLVFVDTTGRAFLDHSHAQEIDTLLGGISIDLRYLVLSLSSRWLEAKEVAEVLASVGYDALLFTKLDETVLPTLCLAAAHTLQKPLSYLTTGQRVPDDIMVVDSDFLSSCFTGGERHARSG